MYSTSDFKKGLNILIDDQPYTVVDFQHVKPGKGNQFSRTKVRNLLTGQLLEKTFKSGEKFGIPDVMFKDMSFMYKDEHGFNFMSQEDFEQITLSQNLVGDTVNYLIENMKTKICFFNDRAVGIELPASVNLRVASTEPGFKGNTVTGTYKPATLETGLVVQVPLHTNQGDLLKIDTESGLYKERVNEK